MEPSLTSEDISALINTLLARVFELSIPTIRKVVSAVGIDASRIPHESEKKGGQGSRAEVVPAVQHLFGSLSEEERRRALPILAERVVEESRRKGSGQSDRVIHDIRQHGCEYIDGKFIPVGLLDERELHFLPSPSGSELAAAFERLRLGDESGAITKACGAVDSAVQAIYKKQGWNDLPNSFQAKVNTALKRLEVFERMEEAFQANEVDSKSSKSIVTEIRDATRHATEALQLIRRTMGDVHGTKRVVRQTVYGSIKWASAICGLLQSET